MFHVVKFQEEYNGQIQLNHNYKSCHLTYIHKYNTKWNASLVYPQLLSCAICHQIGRVLGIELGAELELGLVVLGIGVLQAGEPAARPAGSSQT